MTNFRIIILLILILLYFGHFGEVSSIAQEEKSANVIREFEDIKVEDVSKELNQKESEEIIRRFTRYYIEIARQKSSDYISSKAPLYTLLKYNFPALKEREEERGVSLGNIIRYLNSNVENRKIIISVLVKEKGQKCS